MPLLEHIKKWRAALFLFFLSLNVYASPIVTTREGGVARWNISPSSPTLNFYIDSNVGTNFAAFARDAAIAWSGVQESYVQLTEVMDPATANIIVRGYASISNALVPQAASYITDSNSNITACTVEILIGADTGATAEYLDYLHSGTIHEMGHCLGLHHSLQIDAVMSYRQNGSSLALKSDDKLAIARLYPNDGNNIYPMGCATVQKSGSGPGGNPWNGLAEMAVLLLALYWITAKIKLSVSSTQMLNQ
jgi:hypothetical protein